MLKSKGPKEKFQQSVKGQQYTLQQLETNLIFVIVLNKENEIVGPTDNGLQYLAENEVRDKIQTAKDAMAKKNNE